MYDDVQTTHIAVSISMIIKESAFVPEILDVSQLTSKLMMDLTSIHICSAPRQAAGDILVYMDVSSIVAC